MRTTIDSVRLLLTSAGRYSIRVAQNAEDVCAAQALRFQVFNLELNEGLAESFTTGLDQDPFDDVCDHLLVQDTTSQQIVGTYRLQTGLRAEQLLGYYSEQEFNFTPYETIRPQVLELGRACVHRAHRNMIVLGLLWKGIALYARDNNARYLFGCSSITSQDPCVGASAYAQLYRKHLAEVSYRTTPTAKFDCPLDQLVDEPVVIPKLLRAYLSLGAKICGPPALDRNFRTIDFLTMLDLESLPALAKQRLFA